MNWLLVFLLWGNHNDTVTQMHFQTKFLCEKAAKELLKVNEVPANVIPLSGYAYCVQAHKVEK